MAGDESVAGPAGRLSGLFFEGARSDLTMAVEHSQQALQPPADCAHRYSRRSTRDPVAPAARFDRPCLFAGIARFLESMRERLESRSAHPRPSPWQNRLFLDNGTKCQPACKPGSVWPPNLAARERGGHSSWAHVAMRLTQPTRTVGRKQPPKVSLRTAPIRSCSRWGLPCRFRCRSRGGLLPHPFTLATETVAVCFLWHFPWGRPRRPLAGTVSPWSPDFPHPQPFGIRGRGRPAGWHGV